ncbi:hypothetical protein BGZ72_000446 [Mortierella alpina]|nr:hypothetical protein BGZ72_000446 [Mortierella alpina]
MDYYAVSPPPEQDEAKHALSRPPVFVENPPSPPSQEHTSERTPEPFLDTKSVLRQITDANKKGSMRVPEGKTLDLNGDIPKPRTYLDPSEKYLGFMMYAGITNQFMALENAAYAALLLNRTLIIPPIVTNSHDKYNSNQRWSDFFDLSRFTALTGIKAVEWHDVRPLTEEQIEVGRQQARLGGKSYPLWNSLAENLTCQVIYGYGDSERLHTTELTFARQFLFSPQFVRPPPRNPNTTVYDRIKIGAKDNTNLNDIVTFEDLVGRYGDRQDPLLFLSHAFKLKDPSGGSRSTVGMSFHFMPKVTDYAARLIRHRAPETRENGGRYIAIHIRRGDIWQKCRSQSEEAMLACIIPLGRYAESVDKARKQAGANLPVIVTTDSKSEEDHTTISRIGWRRLNHEVYTTEEELGIFGPAIVDAAILADAEVMIGTQVSSMSRVAARRQKSWHQRDVIYPRTTPSWTPTV